MKAARHLGRHGERDAAMVLLMFRHGLRTAELVSFKWSQVDLKRDYPPWHAALCPVHPAELTYAVFGFFIRVEAMMTPTVARLPETWKT